MSDYGNYTSICSQPCGFAAELIVDAKRYLNKQTDFAVLVAVLLFAFFCVWGFMLFGFCFFSCAFVGRFVKYSVMVAISSE